MEKRSISRVIRCLIIIWILSILNYYIVNILDSYISLLNRNVISVGNEAVRAMQIEVEPELIAQRAEELSVSPGELLAVISVLSDYKITKECVTNIDRMRFVRTRNFLIRRYPENYKQLKNIYNGLMTDMKYFPVPKSIGATKWVEYADSWGYERTYGGERRHEGTDIMALEKEDGRYPVISVCDGTVTNAGWLELGGYRIGITSASGIYYYYAHLDSYIKEFHAGDEIKAGEVLGFMGSTGYSKVEGTKGKFDTHLHFGIYVESEDGGELAVNPYWLLYFAENKLLYYNY